MGDRVASAVKVLYFFGSILRHASTYQNIFSAGHRFILLPLLGLHLSAVHFANGCQHNDCNVDRDGSPTCCLQLVVCRTPTPSYVLCCAGMEASCVHRPLDKLYHTCWPEGEKHLFTSQTTKPRLGYARPYILSQYLYLYYNRALAATI